MKNFISKLDKTNQENEIEESKRKNKNKKPTHLHIKLQHKSTNGKLYAEALVQTFRNSDVASVSQLLFLKSFLKIY